MVDYQSYAAIIAKTRVNHDLIPVNHIWLQTGSTPVDLANVRNALNTSPLSLDNLFDRRALSGTLSSDPLSLNLLGLLSIGATAALLLALTGNLLISWLSVRRRLTDFTVLRALGAPPAQSAGVLLSAPFLHGRHDCQSSRDPQCQR